MSRTIYGGNYRAPTGADEKTYPDVGGGFVEPHPRGPGIDWDNWGDEYPYKVSVPALCMKRETRT